MSVTLKSLGFVGAGQMAKAIGLSLVRLDLIKASEIIVSCPAEFENDLKSWADMGCRTTFHNRDVVGSSENVIWATKPHLFSDAVKQVGHISHFPHQQRPFQVSIMAGIPLQTFQSVLKSLVFKDLDIGTARVMPNVGMKVGAGCAVYTPGNDATHEQEQVLVRILSSIGSCYKVKEEQINAFCGLFGSGIGFMFPILEAMSDGGVRMGIPRDLSTKIAAQTMKGAAELILHDDSVHPGTLKDSVCSPGGTTIAGISELEKHGIRNAIISAITAATLKGEELGRENSEPATSEESTTTAAGGASREK